jgi:hypothetical protein
LFWWAHKNDRAGTYKMDFCAGAAYGGILKVLQWARENGYPWDSTTCANAATGDHLHVLKWARANSCPWDITTCMHAAGGGNLEVLQWARRNGPGHIDWGFHA